MKVSVLLLSQTQYESQFASVLNHPLQMAVFRSVFDLKDGCIYAVCVCVQVTSVDCLTAVCVYITSGVCVCVC